MLIQKILYPNGISHEELDFGFLRDLLPLDCFTIVDQKEDLACFRNPKLQKWLELDEFLILGTGGSSLGAQCIYEIARTNSEILPKRIQFVSNLDPCSLRSIFSSVKNPNRVGVLCVSKSGETLETITQLMLVIGYLQNKNISSQVVVITEDKTSTLKQIAVQNNLLCLDHPKTIGGRYSVFSIVGMLPALMCGIDPNSIREGAKEILHGDLDCVKEGSAFVFRNFKRKITNHISFVYSDKLLPFAEWLAQLYAESSGKDGVGITPITAHGSVDQHSQLQLYLDGTGDKCFSFFQEKQDCNTCIDVNVPEKFSYLSGKKISDIFEAQCNATISSLTEKERPLRKFELAEITPKILGELFMHFMIEVPCVCKLIGVNPFDQPAVERGKIITKILLNERAQTC